MFTLNIWRSLGTNKLQNDLDILSTSKSKMHRKCCPASLEKKLNIFLLVLQVKHMLHLLRQLKLILKSDI